MKFSAFAPLGLLAFAAGPSPAKRIYDDMVRGLGGAEGDLGVMPGTYLDGKCFSRAIRIALARKHLIRAKRQTFPATVDVLITNREYEYGAVPAVDATIVERRAELSRRMTVPSQASQVILEAELTELLGDDFIALRTTSAAEAVVNPTSVGAAPENLQRPEVTRKVVRLSGAVSFIGIPQTVAYELVEAPVAGNDVAEQALVVGDVLVVDPGTAIADRITATAVGGGFLTATFSKPHSASARGFTMPLPQQVSTKRHTVVVLTDAAAADPEKRRIVNEHLGRRMRATSTWGISGGTSSSTTGFEIGAFGLGMTTLAPIAL